MRDSNRILNELIQSYEISVHISWIDSYNRVLESLLFKSIKSRYIDECDAVGTLFMVKQKLCSIKAIIESSNIIIDFASIAILTRSIMEMVGVFHCVFYSAKNEEEKDFLYNLWFIDSLNRRQQFVNNMQTTEGKQMLEQEKKEIIIVANKLYKSIVFSDLETKSQNKIKNIIKGINHQYLGIISGNTIKTLKWTDIPMLLLRKDFAEQNYNFLSQYVHPSNNSVTQYVIAENKNAAEQTMCCLHFCFAYVSIMIYEYIKSFCNNKVSCLVQDSDMDRIKSFLLLVNVR